MRLFFRHALIHIKSAMEYRASFLMIVLTQFFSPLTAAIGIYLLFDRFGSIEGWTFSQVLLCFSITYMAYSIAECFARGFDLFSSLIRLGTFDRLLVQPVNVVLSVFCSDFAFNRIGKFVFAAGMLVFACASSEVVWTGDKLFTLALMVTCGALIFMGVFIAFSAISFFTVEGIEVVNIFTDGGRELSSYPLNIYVRFIRDFFTFVIPFGMMNYLSLLFLLGRAPAYYGLMPLYGIVFFFLCCLVFMGGVRHYRSAG